MIQGMVSPVGNWIVERVGSRPAVLFHVPHAGTFIPGGVRADIVLDDQMLDHVLLDLSVWHTDVIDLAASLRCVLGSVNFFILFSRLVIDP